jgi:hypothetical protein
VSKSGLIDAISTTTSLMNCQTGNALHASVRAVVNDGGVAPCAVFGGSSHFNPTQRGTPKLAPSMTSVASVIEKGLKKTAKKSTNKAVRGVPAANAAESPVDKVARCAPVTLTSKRAPARYTAKRSANKAVRRAPVTRPAQHAPARKAAKLSAKKAVRRA